jgi:sugar/nucleoside kinase (ribokinase family)
VKTVVAIGEILVEILASRRGQTFLAPGPLEGPFPSGAPAIFIDQVARLGQPCAMIGCVGNDDFGKLNIERLRADGVDVSAIETHATVPTGTAFVTYREDGGRHFVFNIRHSASGHLKLGDAANRVLDRADHLHVMGSSLFSPAVIEAIGTAAKIVKRRGGTISFDPNVRSEVSPGSDVAAAFDAVLSGCDLVLPSGPEILSLTREADETRAVAKLLARGVGAVVLKRGDKGAGYRSRSESFDVAPLPVEELDPTGAGDCFGGTFVACWLRGMSARDCLRYANAAGARKVLTRGPMEGVSTMAELDAFVAAHEGQP